MVPIYICDDDKTIVDYMVKVISNFILIYGYDMKIKLADTNPEELLKARENETQRAIYFLDVDLKHEKYNGFSLAKEIRKMDTRGFLVFVTTYEELVYETFKYRLEAMSYLIKGNEVELSQQIGECLAEINLLITREVTGAQSYYTLKLADSTYQIPVSEILYFETSHVNHRIILHAHQRILEFRGDLKAVEKEVSDEFCRVHRSFLVNVNKIEKVDYAGNSVELEGGYQCPLSRKGKKFMKELLG